MLARTKKELECFLKDLNLCGNLSNINGVWMYRLVGKANIYRATKHKNVTCVPSWDISYVIDKLKSPDIVICEV